MNDEYLSFATRHSSCDYLDDAWQGEVQYTNGKCGAADHGDSIQRSRTHPVVASPTPPNIFVSRTTQSKVPKEKNIDPNVRFFFIQITPPILAPKSEANLPLKCGTVRRNWCVEFHPNDAFSKSGQDAWANMLNWKHMLTDANADVGRSPA